MWYNHSKPPDKLISPDNITYTDYFNQWYKIGHDIKIAA